MLRVASVPRRHVYVRHLSWPGDGVERVAPPDRTYRAATVLDPDWIRSAGVDCAHTHFGFGDVPPGEMARWIDALRDQGIGLVHTVHDLENPHRTDPERHRAQLDLLVPAADRVITLTPSVAEVIRRRWGREAVVLPHPHVVPLRFVGRRRPRRRGPLRIGLHAKDLRAGHDVAGALAPLVDHVVRRPDTRLVLDVYPAAAARLDGILADTPGVDRLRSDGRLVVRTSPYGTDRRFVAYVRTIDVAVLPYRVGTHSGWAEACVDVGTHVVVSDRTHVHRQHPCITAVPLHDDGFDAAALDDAIDAFRDRTPRPARRADREAQRRHLSAAHAALYREAAG